MTEAEPRILVVLGTRPEAIKLAPVINALRATPDALSVRVCVTGQHREMLTPILELFGIVPDYQLGLMTPNQKLARLTSAILDEITPVLDAFRPDWVIVQGDTTTALAACLASFYQGVRVAHVEAGLRTNDKRRPFPEEANRRIVDTLSDLHFAPTERARRSLLAEGTNPATVHVTGNTVIDALCQISTREYDIGSSPLAGIPFDVLPELVPVAWEAALPVLRGSAAVLSVVDLDSLIRLKLKAQGHQDLMDVAMLVLLHPRARRAALEQAAAYRVRDRLEAWLKDSRLRSQAREEKRR